jgi:hypothetical protein
MVPNKDIDEIMLELFGRDKFSELMVFIYENNLIPISIKERCQICDVGHYTIKTDSISNGFHIGVLVDYNHLTNEIVYKKEILTSNGILTREEDEEIEKEICRVCGNDSFRLYISSVIDDARLYCTECGLEMDQWLDDEEIEMLKEQFNGCGNNG